MNRYFGTDGIRGTVGQPPVTADFALRLGHALGLTLRANDQPPLVVIGKDTRLSGYMFESALEAGLASAGTDIRLLGPMPTPGIAYLTRSLRAGAGIVISASHNPYQDNGFKFFSATGEKLLDNVQAQLEDFIDQDLVHCAPSEIGRAERVEDAAGRYIEFCKRTVPSDLSLKDMKIVVDCAQGAAYQIAPRVLTELGADLVVIGNQPNGMNINQGYGSTQPQRLIKAVVAHHADAGIALDGDGDRVLMVDSHGELLNGDQLLFIMACHRKSNGSLKGGIVGTLMSNFGFQRALEDQQIEFVRADVGDRHVHKALTDRGWELGGEASGHIISLDKTTTGDGLVSALEILQIMRQSGRSLNELKQGMSLFPQVMINVPLERKFDISAPAISAAVVECENRLADDGRLILRESGTEPLVRVTVEGRDADLIETLASDLADVVREVNQS